MSRKNNDKLQWAIAQISEAESEIMRTTGITIRASEILIQVRNELFKMKEASE